MKLSPFALGLILLGRLAAQQTVAPSDETVGPVRGQGLGGYNVTNSFETGYRFLQADGNIGKYQSDVNYGNGIRLLSSSLTLHSEDGHGTLFDDLTIATQGLGNDPYQFATLRIGKNGLYKYDLTWRLNDYVNPGLTFADGEHAFNTQRRIQDHDLTLFPQSAVRFFLGYTRNAQDGPAMTTVNIDSHTGDEFPLFANVHRVQNDYRLGGEVRFFGVRLNVLRGWEDFKEDTPTALPGQSLGNNVTDLTTLSSLRRTEPYHGTTPFWRLGLFSEKKDRVSVAGRLTYAMGRRDYVFDQTAIGTDPSGAAQNRQTFVSSSGSRPVFTSDLTVSVFPTTRLTISNQTAVNNVRIDGGSTLIDFNNAVGLGTRLDFQFLGIRTIVNTTDATYRVNKKLGFHAGYEYSAREIRSNEQAVIGGAPIGVAATQDNHLHSGSAGVRLTPYKRLTFSLDGEVGRADRPIFPISERNYHTLNARVRFKTKTLSLSAAARSNYNTNSVSLSSSSSHGRNYSFDGSWMPTGWFAVDAGYSKLHLDTASGIFYFLPSGFAATGNQSIYISNIHSGNLGARLGIRRIADLYLGYNQNEDTGDGRSNPFIGPGALLPAFVAAQTFPVNFRTPMARLSVRLHEKLRWNFGYQYYSYREDFSNRQNYFAHTGYTSLKWSF
jgi:hypothetical protein